MIEENPVIDVAPAPAQEPAAVVDPVAEPVVEPACTAVATMPAMTACVPKGMLLGRVHDISAFASTDETRYVLNGVHVDPVRRFVEATNGRFLIRVPVPDRIDEFPPVEDNSPAADVIIPSAIYSKAIKASPKNGNMASLRHARFGAFKKQEGDVGTMVKLTTTNLDTELCTKVRAIDGNYPNTDMVIPLDEAKASICLSPAYLRTICDYADKNGAESIKIMLVDDTSAARVSIPMKDEFGEIVTAIVVLMPWRMS